MVLNHERTRSLTHTICYRQEHGQPLGLRTPWLCSQGESQRRLRHRLLRFGDLQTFLCRSRCRHAVAAVGSCLLMYGGLCGGASQPCSHNCAPVQL